MSNPDIHLAEIKCKIDSYIMTKYNLSEIKYGSEAFFLASNIESIIYTKRSLNGISWELLLKEIDKAILIADDFLSCDLTLPLSSKLKKIVKNTSTEKPIERFCNDLTYESIELISISNKPQELLDKALYQGGEVIEVIEGKNKGKKGYVGRVDNTDNTLLIIDGLPETEKYRVDINNVRLLNTNFAIYGYKETNHIDGIHIKERIYRTNKLCKTCINSEISEKKDLICFGFSNPEPCIEKLNQNSTECPAFDQWIV